MAQAKNFLDAYPSLGHVRHRRFFVQHFCNDPSVYVLIPASSSSVRVETVCNGMDGREISLK